MNENGEIMKIKIGLSLLLLAVFLSGTCAEAARIKDIAEIGGVRDNQLIGYGLVVGLAGTGDDVKNGFTKETLANLLSRQGLSTKDKTLKADNIAAAMVTANLPAFSRIGTRIDVSVSSIGDAKSLQGGTLLLTPLRGADGEIYAVAQGPLTLGGFSAGGAGGSVTKNHTNVGFIANGAFVERELKHELDRNRAFTLNLHSPDFTTAKRLTEIVAQNNPYVDARQVDSRTVALKLKAAFSGTMVDLIPQIESLDVPVDSTAVVVMNEKTGTVVMGENVRISTVAIAHGNLSVQIKEEQKVSQPLPFAPAPPAGSAPATPGKSGAIVAPGGQTVVTTDKTVGVGEEQKQLMVVSRGVTIQDVVKALNAIGVTPRDLITILQTIKAAGALQADLRLI
ncbi:MAG: flagellar basal body P-ring protein FlgI [Syntrophales bacterium]|jgi:flagellar P-ring protein precursor FlgI|nr:flagellar basal body P-ring protein FlgI [Syntrophales bacterium]